MPEDIEAGAVLWTASDGPFSGSLSGEVEIPGDEAVIFEVTSAGQERTS